MMTVSNLAMIDKGMKFRNIWIVAMYLLLNLAGRFLISAYNINPSATKLQYHLPGDQLVMLDGRKDLFNIVDEPNAQETMLTMWFEANKAYQKLDNLYILIFLDCGNRLIHLTDGRFAKKVRQLVDFPLHIQIMASDIIYAYF